MTVSPAQTLADRLRVASTSGDGMMSMERICAEAAVEIDRLTAITKLSAMPEAALLSLTREKDEALYRLATEVDWREDDRRDAVQRTVDAEAEVALLTAELAQADYHAECLAAEAEVARLTREKDANRIAVHDANGVIVKRGQEIDRQMRRAEAAEAERDALKEALHLSKNYADRIIVGIENRSAVLSIALDISNLARAVLARVGQQGGGE